MGKKLRGRHRSTSREGRDSIKIIEGIPGVIGVTLGQADGRKGVGASKPVGYVKVQRETPGGLRALLKGSYAAHDLFIMIEQGQIDAVRKAILEHFP